MQVSDEHGYAPFAPGEVLVLPFPFTDREAIKRRPALVISDSQAFNLPSGHLVAAMITSADHHPWPLDTPIENLDAAGLSHESVVRMKLFTLDARLVLRRAGALAPRDWQNVRRQLQTLLQGDANTLHEPLPSATSARYAKAKP